MYHRRIYLVSLLLTVVLFIAVLLCYRCSEQENYCFCDDLDFTDNDTQPLPHVLELVGTELPTPDSIFFHDTTCRRGCQGPRLFHEQLNLATLSVPHACAVESAALHNPGRMIFVLFADAVYWRNGSMQPQLHALRAYRNVRLYNAPLNSYYRFTPMESWVGGSRRLYTAKYLQWQLQQVMMGLSLWHYGGMVLDMDTLVLRSLEDLPPNLIWQRQARNGTAIVPGLMQLSVDMDGTSYALLLLKTLMDDFDPKERPHMRPSLLQRWLERVCREHAYLCEQLTRMNATMHATLVVQPLVGFATNGNIRYVMSMLPNDLYLLHVYNHDGQNPDYRINPQSVYGALSQYHCPCVFHAVNAFL